MNKAEAIKLMLDGEKVYPSGFSVSYLYFDTTDNLFKDESGWCCDVNNFNSDNWIIYQEPVCPLEQHHKDFNQLMEEIGDKLQALKAYYEGKR